MPGKSTVYVVDSIIISFGAFVYLLTLTIILHRELVTVASELNSLQKYTYLWILSLLEDQAQE